MLPWEQIGEGFLLCLRWDVMGMLALGMVLGVVVGALPGLTAAMAVAVLMPISFFIDPLLSIPFLLAITKGAIFGGCNPLYDVPRLLGLYNSGDLKLDELITRRYRLDEVNQGYQDMLDGKNIRGVLIHEHRSHEH